MNSRMCAGIMFYIFVFCFFLTKIFVPLPKEHFAKHKKSLTFEYI